MGFLLPGALWSLLAVPVVVFLHLVRHRRHPVPVASLEIWNRVAQDLSIEGKRRRFRLGASLWLEIAIVTTLALALSRPFLERGTPVRPILEIRIDGSASMQARLDDGSSPAQRAREVSEQLAREEGYSEVRITIDPSGFDDGPALEGTPPPDRIVYLSDRPSPLPVEGEEKEGSSTWIPVALGEGTNLAWTRVGVDPAPGAPHRILLTAIQTGAPPDPTSPIEVRFEGPDSELLTRRPLTFGPDGRAELIVDESTLGADPIDRISVRLCREGGEPLDDALPTDDRLLLARNPVVQIALPGGGPTSVRRALERWSTLGLAEWDGSPPGPDLLLLDRAEPPGTTGARAIVLPGATARGVAFGEGQTGGWIDRLADHPLTEEVAWNLLRPARIHLPTSLPEGTTPLAWIGGEAVAWETDRGDLVLAFDLEPSTFGQTDPPEAIPHLLLALLLREQPAPGRLTAYRPGDPVPPALRRRGIEGPLFGGTTTRLEKGDGVAAAIVTTDANEARVARHPQPFEPPPVPEPSGRAPREITLWLIAAAFVLTLAYTARRARRTA